jgi:hypothetical protein
MVKDMSGRLANFSLPKTPPSYYLFSKNRREISTPQNNSHTGEFGKGTNIAFVKRTFTASAYAYGLYILSITLK